MQGMLLRSYWRIGMDCKQLSYVRLSGRKSICVMGACMLIARKAGSKACTRYMGQSFERYDHCGAIALTCSRPKEALQSLLLGSCEWFSVQGVLQSFPSLSTHTCSGMLADTSSRTMVTTRVRWRTISGIETFNLLRATQH